MKIYYTNNGTEMSAGTAAAIGWVSSVSFTSMVVCFETKECSLGHQLLLELTWIQVSASMKSTRRYVARDHQSCFVFDLLNQTFDVVDAHTYVQHLFWLYGTNPGMRIVGKVTWARFRHSIHRQNSALFLSTSITLARRTGEPSLAGDLTILSMPHGGTM